MGGSRAPGDVAVDSWFPSVGLISASEAGSANDRELASSRLCSRWLSTITRTCSGALTPPASNVH
eukprot:scaffold1811_cov411-Prasinococcus_capsulatus_cf.AAC.9